MIPGIKQTSELARQSALGVYTDSPSKKAKDIEAVAKKNNENMKLYGASISVGQEPRMYRGGGGLTNQNMAKPANRYSPDDQQ